MASMLAACLTSVTDDVKYEEMDCAPEERLAG